MSKKLTYDDPNVDAEGEYQNYYIKLKLNRYDLSA